MAFPPIVPILTAVAEVKVVLPVHMFVLFPVPLKPQVPFTVPLLFPFTKVAFPVTVPELVAVPVNVALPVTMPEL